MKDNKFIVDNTNISDFLNYCYELYAYTAVYNYIKIQDNKYIQKGWEIKPNKSRKNAIVPTEQPLQG